jgi:hypothetical protein
MSNKEKMIQIPEELFLNLCKLTLLDDCPSEVREECQRGIERKLDAIVNHDLYSRYKTASTASQREQARQEYLNRVGIPNDFRW